MQKLFLTDLEARSSRSKRQSIQFLLRALNRNCCGLQMAVFSLSPHMAFSHAVHAMERKRPFFLSPFKTTHPIRLGCNPYHRIWGFPGSSAGKESTCNSGDPNSILGLGRSPGERDKIPTPVFWGFPDSSGSKESACYVGNLGWEDPLEESKPTLVFLPGESP